MTKNMATRDRGKIWALAVALLLSGVHEVLASLILDVNGQSPIPKPALMEAGVDYNGSPVAADIIGFVADKYNPTHDPDWPTTVGSLLYKYDPSQTPTDSGLIPASYETSQTSTTPQTWTISYVSGDVAAVSYLLMKDGNGGAYLWNLAGRWNGKEQLQIVNNLWPAKDDPFSHVEFYGTVVPEPGTLIAGALLLLPFAASTLRPLWKNQKG